MSFKEKVEEQLRKMKQNERSLAKIGWGVLVVVVVLVLIFVINPGDGEKEDKKDKNNNNEESSEVVNGDALENVQPVVAGEYEYEFSGVSWIFDTEDPQVAGTGQTWLKMMFADFTRNGSEITFGRPYKLGFHPGTCTEVDFIDSSSEAGIPIAYAECSDGNLTRQFVVLQELQDVVVKMKEVKEDEETPFQEWYKIDVTEIVR